MKNLIKANQDFDLVIGAKNIRKELKETFPRIKFTVRTSRYSMGNSITVSWTNGPMTKEVDQVINKYEYGTFDSMTDCSSVVHTNHIRNYGGSKFVITDRYEKEQMEALK